MKHSKKIIALFIAMLMVLSFIPFTVVKATDTTEIKELNVELPVPIPGNKVLPIGWTGTDTENIVDDGEMEPDNTPDAYVTTEHVIFDGAYWVTGTFKERPADWDQLFFGTFKEDTYYYADISVKTTSGYKFGEGLKIKINGEEPAEVFGLLNEGTTTHFIAKVKTTTTIKKLDLTVTAPEVGTKLVDEETPAPTITLPKDADYKVTWTMFINNYPSKDEKYDDGSIFGTTVEKDKDYYLEIYLAPSQIGGVFAGTDDVAITVNGGKEFELGYCSDTAISIFTKVTAGATTEEPAEESSEEPTQESEEPATEETGYKVLDGANQKLNTTKSKVLKFRFDIDYAKFTENGKVYVDNKLVDSKNYTSKEGSTIITFTEDYVDTLALGKHNVKVAVDDGEVSADFTITSSNPATGDNIVGYVAIFAIAILGTIVLVKKNRK